MRLSFCAVVLAAVRSAAAQEVVIAKLATVAPDNTPWSEQLAAYKKRVESAAAGKVKVKPYLGGSLGDENLTVSECKRGAIQLWGGSTGALASVVPELALLELPYLFGNAEEADHVLDDVVFADFEKLLAQRGFVLLFWAENGYRSFGTKFGPVKSPDALKGKKMRSQESDVHIDTYRALGASPVPIAVTEVLNALQTGIVDGFDNTPLFAFAASWYQGIKHYTVTEHIYQPAAVLASKKWFDGLPPDIQKAIRGDPKTEAALGRKGVRAIGPDLLQNFAAAGIEVHALSAEEKAAFAKATEKVHDQFARGKGKSVAPLLKKVKAALAAMRAGKK